ncbi:MAG: cation:proton antiporter, partial [Verrucomicrobiota bacterium]
AELGVSLLLFAIGLEFSAKRLIGLGPAAIYGGTFQVCLTLGVGACLAHLAGLGLKASIAVGATVALSSTACVLRLLIDRAELDAPHGKTALGVLLLQDVAVVPLFLLVAMLGGEGSITEMTFGMLKAIGLVLALIVVFSLLSRFVLPKVMRELSIARDRELLVLLSVVLAVGSALAAHALELSPALGAFLAGMLLAESPFASQIRSDIGGLRIIFITLFFASVGMLGDPAWIANHWPAVIGMTALIVCGKALVVTAIALFFGLPLRHAIASGVVLAQVGEFGVVIAGTAVESELISSYCFRLLVSSTILTLFLTPLLTRIALPLGIRIRRLTRRGKPMAPDDISEKLASSQRPLVFVVGFGPSGRRVANGLRGDPETTTVIVEMNQNNVDMARSMGHHAVLGDASSLEFLIHHGISDAFAVVITIPDHRGSVRIVESVKTLNPSAIIVARARYHAFVGELERAGATVTVDEEYLTGRRLQRTISDLLDSHRDSESSGNAENI